MSSEQETRLADGLVGVGEWVRRWQEDEAHWHQSKADKHLGEYEQKLFGGKKGARVFVPLCGKSPDLIWMYERGYTVVGVELAEDPIRELYIENGIPYNVEKLADNASVYTSEDKRLQIYNGNMFSLSSDRWGQFDAVWDSRSLTAINVTDRERYRDLILSLMRKDATCLLKSAEYDQSVWPGPPHSLTDAALQELYGKYH